MDFHQLIQKQPIIIDNLFTQENINHYFATVKGVNYSMLHKSKNDLARSETLFVHYFVNADIMKTLLYKKIIEIFDKKNVKVSLSRCYVHNYGIDSQTAPHKDSSSPTVMYYANPIWNIEWGGETYILNEESMDISHAIIPKPGRLVIFDGDTLHLGKPTTCKAEERRYAIVFKFNYVNEE